MMETLASQGTIKVQQYGHKGTDPGPEQGLCLTHRMSRHEVQGDPSSGTPAGSAANEMLGS